MKVKYTGNSDYQIFDAADFKKAELEGKKTVFAKNNPVEVSDEIGEALTGSEGIFGPYSFEKVEDTETPEVEGADDDVVVDDEPELATEGKKATTEGTANPDAGTTTAGTTTAAGGTKSTGRGSSTRSR